MSFWEHLTELFVHLRRILLVLVVASLAIMVVPVRFSGVGLAYETTATLVIQALQDQFLTEQIVLIPLTFFAPLEVYFFISLILGAAVSVPVASYELYRFFNPALHPHEKRFAAQFLAAFVGLFAFGLVLGYLFVVPMTFQTILLFSNLTSLALVYHFTEFFSMAGMILLVCGLLFTFPIYVYLLVRAGVLRTAYLTQNRKYMYGAILVAIAVIDPDPSLITELITFLPIVLLMEVTLILAKRFEDAKSTDASTDVADSGAGEPLGLPAK
jgi:sec-independent protein translocase protein TatC